MASETDLEGTARFFLYMVLCASMRDLHPSPRAALAEAAVLGVLDSSGSHLTLRSVASLPPSSWEGPCVCSVDPAVKGTAGRNAKPERGEERSCGLCLREWVPLCEIYTYIQVTTARTSESEGNEQTPNSSSLYGSKTQPVSLQGGLMLATAAQLFPRPDADTGQLP